MSFFRKRVLALLCGASIACRSEELPQKLEPALSASANANTTIVERELVDASVPACTVHFVSDAFTPAHAATAGTIRVDGDYTRTLANIKIAPAGSAAWSGQFSGPRDSFLDIVRSHLCTAASVYALKANGNKEPSKGPVALDAFVMTADAKGDLENLCNAYSRARIDAGNANVNAQLRDRAAMEWAEDVLTTTRWDAWRRSFARELRDAYAQNPKDEAKEIFSRRAGELESAAAATGMKCETASLWKKRAP